VLCKQFVKVDSM